MEVKNNENEDLIINEVVDSVYNKEQIDKLISNLVIKINKSIKGIRKSVKDIEIPDKTDYDLINETIDNKIELAFDNATEIRKYIDDRISEVILNANEINNSIKELNEKLTIETVVKPEVFIDSAKPEIKSEVKPIVKKGVIEYPEFIINNQGIKKKFLKINRTTKEPIYQ